MFCLGVRDNDKSKGDIDHISTGHLLQQSLACWIQCTIRLLSCYNEQYLYAAKTLVHSAVYAQPTSTSLIEKSRQKW